MKLLEDIHMIGVDWKLVDPGTLARLERLVDEAYEIVYPHVSEVVILATCNRFEIYVANGEGCEPCLDEVRLFFETRAGISTFRVLHGIEAVRHLFRVAAGLESMILGEPEILGQVKRAYEYAMHRAYVGKLLGVVFRHAIRVGKRVRTETRIGEGSIGIPGAAVVLANEVVGLRGRSVGIIGAGDAAKIIVEGVLKHGVKRVLIANRTRERAEKLASLVRDIPADIIPWEKLEELMRESDIVFAALSVDKPIIPGTVFSHAKPGLVVIDVSNVPVFTRIPESIRYYGFQDVVEVARRMAERRRSEVPKAEAIIEEELEKFENLVRKKAADEAIEAMMRFAKAMVDREVARAISVLKGRGVSIMEVEDVLRDLAWSSVRKSLRPLIVALQEAAREGRLKMLEEVKLYFDREFAKVVNTKKEG